MRIKLFSWKTILGFLFLTGLLTQTIFALEQKGPNVVRPAQYLVQGDSGFCPLQTQEQWQQFIERYADNPKWVETCEDSSCDDNYFAFVKRNIQQTFEACAQFITQHDEINRCTENMRNFTVAWMQQHNEDSYGFTVDNHTYLTQQEAPDKPPGMMKLPHQLEEALPDLNRVVKAAQDNGWRYLVHDSALGGFRTFILISDPQGRFDQWALINLRKGESNIQSGTPLSMIAVQKKDMSGHKLPQIHIHFRDYSIDKIKTGYKLSLFEGANGKCYSCHTSGMRQLIARRTPILEAMPVRGEFGFGDAKYAKDNDFAYQRLMEFNRRIRSYGMPDWDGKIIPEHHGPVLGSTHSCTECHNGQSRGVLTISTSPNQLRQKMVAELVMPPDYKASRWLERSEMKNPPLSQQEKNALDQAESKHEEIMNNFLALRFPELRKWLVERSCILKQ